MKIFRLRLGAIITAVIVAVIATSPTVYAATSPTLGVATPFAILASTYTNTAPGTTLNGDLGYTTGPAVAPTVNGDTHAADGTYTQAGIAQGSALVDLNNQACDFSYAPGAVDLATDVTTPDGVGQFTPGVYCIDGASSIGGGGTITLTGAGTYIFRMDGALTTSANSIVQVAGGASECDIWWTPTAATTLGADSTFIGTDIDASGITIGNNVTWTGRALAFGGTVSTDADTITVPAACNTVSDDDDSTGGGSGTGTGADSADTPGLPATGYKPKTGGFWQLIIPSGIFAVAASFYLLRYHRTN